MQIVNNFVAFLKGKKTYILVILGVGTVLAQHYGYLSSSNEQQALWVLGFGSIAAVRSALANLIQGSPATQ